MKVDILRSKYNLKIESPLILSIGGQEISFDALIKGYGANNGMIIDSDGDKLSAFSSILLTLNYGYSCLNLNAPDITDGFDEILDDWSVNSI